MNRTLGILIPSEALEDDQIYDFCKTYLEQGIFQELKVEKYQSPKNPKPKPLKIHEMLFGEKKITQNEAAIRYGMNEDYVIWSISFFMLFWRRNQTKVLEKADLLEWVKTIRLLIEKEKRDIARMYKHFQWMETLDNDNKDRFWFNTVDSISGIRKHWDKIEKQWYLSEPKKEVKPFAPGF